MIFLFNQKKYTVHTGISELLLVFILKTYYLNFKTGQQVAMEKD